MGNHEYCTDCGLSSFHYGKPCPPKAYARHQKLKLEIEEYNAKLNKAARALCDKLKAEGLPAKLNEYGHVFISKFDIRIR